ncbi:MAG: radical SAM family heme chaperone HemW [Micrococcales bacterium]|nr:radical SAM family heme chaperone HemW [Micrococcales bacterium]
MSPALPDGDPAPPDGALPSHVAQAASRRAFGVYVHVPFCQARCGYCDFNTYTVEQVGPQALAGYVSSAGAEIALAASVLEAAGLPDRLVDTVFFGGGTPTVLPVHDLAAVLDRVRRTWGLAQGAEVTVEANPDTVTTQSLAALAEAGFTRVSFGMQSAVPHVLATLERSHDPQQVPRAVGWARSAGLRCSLDLVYGTPGESLEDWASSVSAALDMPVEHLSAYALTLEPATAMGNQILRGTLAAPDPDVQAQMYEMVDDAAASAGLDWYEISSWAAPGAQCRHNLGYWNGDDWWGIGPGAHSHVGGMRWWNAKHPRTWAQALADGASPAAGRETLRPDQVAAERVMLQVRLRDGLPLEVLGPAARQAVAQLVADGLVDGPAAVRRAGAAVVLTRAGRLLADTVVRALDCHGTTPLLG